MSGVRGPASVAKVTVAVAKLGNGLNSARSSRSPGAVEPDGTYQLAEGVVEQEAVVEPVGPVRMWDTATWPPVISTTAEA